MQELRWIDDRRNLKEAQADLAARRHCWHARYPRLTDWIEQAIGETLTFSMLRTQHHEHLESTTPAGAPGRVD